MSTDYDHSLYLDRGARGVEDDAETRVADAIRAGTIRLDELDRQTLAIRRTEQALSNTVTVEVSPAGVAAVEALAGLLAWRAVDRAAVYDSVEYVDALYRLRDLADRLGAK